MLARHQPKPRSEVSPFAKRLAGPDRRDKGRGGQRTDAGDVEESLARLVLGGDGFDRSCHAGQLRLKPTPLFPKPAEELTETSGDRRLLVRQDHGELALEDAPPASQRESLL